MWHIKAFVQLILSFVPMGEKINYWLQMLNGSRDPERGLISRKYRRERVIRLSKIMRVISAHKPLEGITVVDIGTGWYAVNPIMLYFMGVRTCHTYDHVRHVRLDQIHVFLDAVGDEIEEMSEITSVSADLLKARLAHLKKCDTLDDLLAAAGIVYHAPADAVTTGLDDKSVDLVYSYSYAVLEHVPEKMIADLTAETNRILKEDGAAFHRIEFHDHYVTFDKKISKVNYLKYPEWYWSLMAQNKISYQNRLRQKQFTEIFEAGGARIELLEQDTDPKDLEQVKTMKIDKLFDGLSPEELAIFVSDFILSFPSRPDTGSPPA